MHFDQSHSQQLWEYYMWPSLNHLTLPVVRIMLVIIGQLEP